MKDIRRRDEVMAAFAVGLTLVGQAMKVVSDVTRKASEALEGAAEALDSQPIEPDEPQPADPTEEPGTAEPPTPEPEPGEQPMDPDLPFLPELPPEGTGPYDQPTRGPYDPPSEPPKNP
jgi:hypothetical protein